MGDVAGLYRRFGVRLPSFGDGWGSTPCFTGAHRDRHPSARVHLQAGTFRCFACGARGGVLDALQILGVRDRDAARQLAVDYGILDPPTRRQTRPPPIPPPTPPPPPVKQTAESAPIVLPAGRVDWDSPGNTAAAVHDRAWVYVDEHGTPVGRVRRLDLADGTKRIWQERPDGDGWATGLAGAELPLYQLPLIHACIREGLRVLVVEGEKAVDALERVGLFATTCAGGAGKWRDQHTEQLAGATVTAIADSDLPGRQHAIDVTQRLHAAGVDARMPLDLFELRNDGSDVVDHLTQVAAAARAINPELDPDELRQRLRLNLEHELGRQLPADPHSLQLQLERARYIHDPAGHQLATCHRCGIERPMRVSHGVAFCSCGAHQSA